METEIFKPIKGYEGYYEISNLGNVKSLKKTWSVGRKKDTILKTGWHKQGYRNVTLCVDKVKKVKLVHRLVAEMFIDNPKNLRIVNHLNSKTDDNRVENLEWTTYSGNAIHGFNFGFRKGQKGLDNPNTKITEHQVRKIKELCNKNQLTQTEIGNIYGISQTQVSRIKYGDRWNHI